MLVVGGSLGAQVLNEIIPRALKLIHPDERPRVVHQAGLQHFEQLQRIYAEVEVSADLFPFIEDMAAHYQWCDLVICRAGATTIAELASVGVASVLVPFPSAVDDHQTANARYLSERNAALLLPQQDLDAERLARLIAGFTRQKLRDMANMARRLAIPDATEKVARVCMELAG
jgi:UDP-N-acetylglucosamine--N-acetylmuramyl-(pentapeptide) pyrophosphoryl-undecaprenol N-acetylglucosamine transferase